jgi:glycosyltransferase involved in cell wall biosynthesis
MSAEMGADANRRTSTISVIVPFGGADERRRSNLAACLRELRRQSYSQYEIVLVVQRLHDDEPDLSANGEVVIQLQDPLNRGFNLSWCRNVGVRRAKGEVVILWDADMIVADVKYLESVGAFPGVFASGASVYAYLNEDEGRLIQDGQAFASVIAGAHKVVPFSRTPGGFELGAAGVLVFRREWYLNVFAGYNENFFRYGWEDKEALARIRFLLGKSREERLPTIDYPFFHLPHGDRDRSNPGSNRALVDRFAAIDPGELCLRLRGAGLGDIRAPTLI